jgi:hypothetical protein
MMERKENMSFVALLFTLQDVDTPLTTRNTELAASPVFLAQQEHELQHLHTICGNPALYRLSFLSDEHPRPALRITMLSEMTLFSVPSLLDALISLPCLQIGTRRYRVDEALLSHSPWAGLSDWTDFLAPPYGQTITLHFGTPLVLQPTATAGYFFPVPSHLFPTLAQCWHDLGGPPLPIASHEIMSRLEDGSIVLADYRLSGCQMLLDGQSHLGFRGSISYHCHHSLETVRIMLTALARFAFFAGAGIETARGLGATRVTIAQGKEQLCSGL